MVDRLEWILMTKRLAKRGGYPHLQSMALRPRHEAQGCQDFREAFESQPD